MIIRHLGDAVVSGLILRNDPAQRGKSIQEYLTSELLMPWSWAHKFTDPFILHEAYFPYVLQTRLSNSHSSNRLQPSPHSTTCQCQAKALSVRLALWLREP